MKHNRITKTIAVALLSLACSTACAQQGAWSGDLNVMGTKLPLVFNFSADGCTLDSPAQGAKDIPAQKSVAEDGTIKVTVAMIGATFEGRMEGDCINGTFAQGALQLPLTLKRGAQTADAGGTIPVQAGGGELRERRLPLRRYALHACQLHQRYARSATRDG